MAKEELIIALKNALELGEDINRAMQTLISSGYDAQEVKEASQYTHNNVLNEIVPIQSLPKINPMPAPEKNLQAPEAPQVYKKLPVQQPTPSDPEATKTAEKRKLPRTLLWLMILVVVLIIGLGLFILFGEPLLSLLYKKV